VGRQRKRWGGMKQQDLKSQIEERRTDDGDRNKWSRIRVADLSHGREK